LTQETTKKTEGREGGERGRNQRVREEKNNRRGGRKREVRIGKRTTQPASSQN